MNHGRNLMRLGRWTLVGLGAALLFGGCAASSSRPSCPPGESPLGPGCPGVRRMIDQDQAELDRSAARLLEAQTIGQQPPACEEARQLGERICTLVERICAIAARHPEDAALQRLCRDDRPRCAQARAAVQARCGADF